MPLTSTDNAVGICSIALQQLGSRPINDFEEASEGARICSALYLEARNDVLKQHPWNCALNRVTLSPDVTPPAFGYQYRFTLPSDYVSVVNVEPVGAVAALGFTTMSYAIEGQYILADTDTINLHYVFRNERESSWSRDLVSVMVARMRMELAYPITKDRAVANDQMQRYELALNRAKLHDAQETPPVEFYGNPLLNARY